MGRNKEYDNAYDSYIGTINKYTSVSKNAYNSAYNNSQKYVGDKGYNRALELGKKGASSASNASISQGTTSARASGMNKAQASAMGNQSAINTYGNQLNAQQQNAYSSGQDAVTNEYNRANGISGVYANRANLSGQATSSQQAEGNNRYNRTWGTIGGIGGLLTSDERLKRYQDISTSFCKKSDEDKDDVEDIMKYKIDIEKYKKGE